MGEKKQQIILKERKKDTSISMTEMSLRGLQGKKKRQGGRTKTGGRHMHPPKILSQGRKPSKDSKSG